MLFHFSPRTPVGSASCHGDTVGLHTMRTLQQVWLRESHYLMQPFWLMRKICKRGCHATGRSSLLRKRSRQGSAALWRGEGKQEEEGRQRRGSGQYEEKEKVEMYWKRFGWEWGGGVEKIMKWEKITSREEEDKTRRRMRAICLRERYDDHNTDSASCQKQSHT